jgi:DNA polymerase I-like protein with 3'-5' exonuclease and polymerase domains
MPSIMKQKYRPIKNFLAIDTESTGLFGHHGCRAFAVSTCDHTGNTKYWETDVDPLTREPKWTKPVLNEIYDYITSFEIHVFHNMNFDVLMLSLLPSRKWASYPKLLESKKQYHDTMIRAHLFDSKTPKGLKEQALLHCDILDDDEKELDDCIKHLRYQGKKLEWAIATEGHEHLAGQKSKFHKCDFWLARAIAKHDYLPQDHEYWHICKTYAVKDAIRTAGLFIRQEQTFETHPELLEPYKIQMKAVFPIFRMSQHGINLHSTKFDAEYEESSNLRNALVASLRRLVKDPTFNPNSGPQLKTYIYDYFKFKVDSSHVTKKGNPSTDKHALPALQSQRVGKFGKAFISTLLLYREVNSAISYMDSYKRFQIAGRLYPSFNQCGTSTTRISSSNPNGQNIGKGKERIDENGNAIVTHSIRRVFGPPNGYCWASIDYDQLQLRIFAYWSKEPELIKAFQSGFDFHTYMAMIIFETDEPTKIQRRVAKNVNFGYIFGAGENKIDSTAGMPGIFSRVQKLFPNVTESIASTISFVRRHGYVLTAGGYRLSVPKNKAYAGVNYIVQGTEGEIVKDALTNCDKFLLDLSQDFKIILQVHDELLFSFSRKLSRGNIYKTLTYLASIMESSGSKFGVPCICKPEVIEDNWAEAIKLEDWNNS